MSTVVVPKRRLTGGLRESFGTAGSVILECEVINPPSRVGQTVFVRFDSTEVTDALLLFRDAAAAIRMSTLKEGEQ